MKKLIGLLAIATTFVVHGATMGVSLAWDPNPESDLSGYRIKYGNNVYSMTNIIDVGNVTSVSILPLNGGTNFFAAQAYNVAGFSSDWCASISAVAKHEYVSDPLSGLQSKNLPNGDSYTTNLVLSLTWPTNHPVSIMSVRWGVAGTTTSAGIETTNTLLRLVNAAHTNYWFQLTSVDKIGVIRIIPEIQFDASNPTNFQRVAITSDWVRLPIVPRGLQDH